MCVCVYRWEGSEGMFLCLCACVPAAVGTWMCVYAFFFSSTWQCMQMQFLMHVCVCHVTERDDSW